MSRIFPLVILLLSFSTPHLTQVGAADWSQFRGPSGNGISSSTGLPTEWSAEKNITWKTKLPGKGSSSPVLFGNQIFLTAYSGYGLALEDEGNPSDLRLHVISINRQNGEIMWDESVPPLNQVQKITKRIVDHGYASGTPACDESGVYAFFGTSGVVAYDLKGKLKWRADVGEGKAGFGSASSPIIYKDFVIVNASIESQTVYALHKKNGEIAWKAENIMKAWTTPSIVNVPGGKQELVVNQKSQIFGFDPDTGKKLWTCEGIQDYVVPVVVQNEGILYCLGGRSNRSIAVRPGGRGDVTKTHKLWEVNIGANVTSPVYYNGHLYWASDRGIAFCLNAKNGEVVYKNRLPTKGRLYASIVLADEKLYITTRDNGVVVLKAAPEYVELARNEIATDENLFNASPAVSEGSIFLRTHGYLYRITNK
ncbi:MAG: PQQ-binding-like beta-propeller repeat protein [Planctomycetes bacterium]|nr:PQQ-binding-like beta-propeller repeat protein [Planctomycetota bacterium]MCH9724338.1 PQQ-binding-like beta-propeller repeat protein [Planctomycetota bacterium]MCH9777357.1 PQQ-binding-like beta-propeller repeat protein [Planctomycetota bacterium]MCH9792320.1 PQQ-binding-like beta-propeller repeat protein [Planctomycetota bacterium]MDF1742163.1 PQQ-binding-like beta-propeller repeat protein [Gimesia sp.]